MEFNQGELLMSDTNGYDLYSELVINVPRAKGKVLADNEDWM